MFQSTNIYILQETHALTYQFLSVIGHCYLYQHVRRMTTSACSADNWNTALSSSICPRFLTRGRKAAFENMNRIRRWFQLDPPASYQPVEDAGEADDFENRSLLSQSSRVPPFSKVEYGISFILGVSMLWAWYVSWIVGDLCITWFTDGLGLL